MMSNFSGFNRSILPIILMGVLEKCDTTTQATRKRLISSQTAGKGQYNDSTFPGHPASFNWCLIFLQELEQQGFTGDTATSYADRLTMSTDNSIYQLLPDAVVFPRSTADVALIARLAAQERYSSLIFTPAAALTVRRSTRGLLLICPAI